MKYIIKISYLGSYPETIINKEEFNKIINARICLEGALAIEEKYELLISNYLDLEKECLNIASNHMIGKIKEYEDFFYIKLLLNRRIVNLLTSTKLYIDQILQHVKVCCPLDNKIKDKVKSLLSNEYDNFFEYRFMEALRNYVQHKGLAIHFVSYGGSKIADGKNWNLEYKTSIFTKKDVVESDGDFKKKVIEEMPDKVNLIYASRVYIESISKIHYEIRNIITSNVEKSRDTISHVIDDYKKINHNESTGLHIICLNGKEPVEEILQKFPLTLHWDDIRKTLVKKNSKLINLKKRYVSSVYK